MVLLTLAGTLPVTLAQAPTAAAAATVVTVAISKWILERTLIPRSSPDHDKAIMTYATAVAVGWTLLFFGLGPGLADTPTIAGGLAAGITAGTAALGTYKIVTGGMPVSVSPALIAHVLTAVTQFGGKAALNPNGPAAAETATHVVTAAGTVHPINPPVPLAVVPGASPTPAEPPPAA